MRIASRYSRFWTTSVLVLMVAACGGGGSSAPNQPPELSSIADVTISANQDSDPIVFTVSDRGAANATITVASSDPGILPEGGIAVVRNQSEFNLVLTPVADTLGSVNVTVTATDRGGLSDQTRFTVTVEPQRQVSFGRYLRTVFADDPSAEPRDVNSRAFVNDAENDDFADLLN